MVVALFIGPPTNSIPVVGQPRHTKYHLSSLPQRPIHIIEPFLELSDSTVSKFSLRAVIVIH